MERIIKHRSIYRGYPSPVTPHRVVGAAVTCSGRSHLNHREENPINFTALFCRKTNKETAFLKCGPIAGIYWSY